MSVLSATRRLPIPERAQRPRREHQPAGAAGGEDPRGGEPGHRDLVAGAPADPRRARAHEDAAEHRHVAAEHPAREQEGDEGPPRAAVLDPPPGVLQARELGQQEVQRGDGQRQEGAEAEQAAAVDLEAVVLLLLGLGDVDRPVVELGRGPCSRARPRLERLQHAAQPACRRPLRPACRGARPRPARGRRPDRRGSARRGRRARYRAWRCTPRRAGLRPRRCRSARARPSRTWRNAGTAWRRGGCLPGNRTEAPSRTSRTAHRIRPSSGAARASGRRPSGPARRRTRAARWGSPSSRSGRGRTSRRSARPRARSAPGGAAAGRRRSRAGTGTTASATTRAPSPTPRKAPGVASARWRRSVGVVPSPMARSARTG